MKIFLIFQSILLIPLSAQVIINTTDIQTQYTIGNTVITNMDTTVTSIDIGSLGLTSWDFSFLSSNPNYALVVTSVDPAGTPYISEFPSADYSLKIIANNQGIQSTSYSYLKLNSDLIYIGSVGTNANVPGSESVITAEPGFVVEALPTDFNTGWNFTSNVVTVLRQNDTTLFTDTSIVISANVVDAYGQMTMPGGNVVDALRIKEDRITLPGAGSLSTYDRHYSYIFLAKSGEQVTVLADTTQPGTGIINNYGYVSWKNAWITSVGNENTLPKKFALEQNYPNPFNPTTSIQYAISDRQFVKLKVYDVLGNEVATLVNEEKSEGSYTVNFNASQLSSGIYFYKLRAGSFVEMKKMVLQK